MHFVRKLFGSRGLYAETLSRHHTGTTASAGLARWFDRRQHRPLHLPIALRPWLLAEGSLTQLLTKLSAGDFHVERIAQDWRRPTLSEARLLNIQPDSWALIREVILWGCGEPWIYARSVLPAASLRGDLRRLRHLKNTSLGALLFRYPHLQRTPFELAQIDGRTLPNNAQCAATLWGRRSRFELNGRALMVGEIFLPALQARASAHQP